MLPKTAARWQPAVLAPGYFRVSGSRRRAGPL